MTSRTQEREPPGPDWARRLPFYYGWIIVAAQYMNVMATSGATLWGFSIFVIPITDDLGWSRPTLFGALTVRLLVGALTMPLIGPLMDKSRWPRIIMIVSGLVLGTSVVGIAFVDSVWQYYLVFGVLGGFSSGGGRMYQAIIPKWFVRRRGRAVSIGSMGSPSGALVFPFLALLLVETLGWRPAIALIGLSTFLLTVPVAFLVRGAPEDIGLLPDGDPPDQLPATREDNEAGRVREPEETSFTVQEIIRSRTTWLIVAVTILAAPSFQGLATNWQPYYRDVGISPEMATLAVTTFGLFGIGGRLIWGLLAERYHIRPVMLALSLLTALSVLWLIQVTNAAMAIASGVMQGLTLGGYMVVSQLIWPTYYGRRHLGAIRGTFTPFAEVSAALGPFLIPVINDATGSTRNAFGAMFFGWLAVALCMYLARPPVRAAPGGGSDTRSSVSAERQT